MNAHLDMDFSFRRERGANRSETEPFTVLVLANFGGRGPGDPVRPAAEIEVRRLDLETVDDYWNLVRPSVRLELEGSDIAIEPREPDDLHPDSIYRKLPVFAGLRAMKRELLDPETGQAALQRLLASQPDGGEGPAEPAESDPQAADEGEDALFERLLGKSGGETAPRRAEAAQTDMLDAFIRRLVAPHVVPEQDPRIDTAVASLDLAASDLMRQVLHHPRFQALEAAWRSLHDAVSEVEWDEHLQLYVCDVSRAELLNALPDPGVSLAESPLFELLVQRRQQAADDSPWTVIAADFLFGTESSDIALLTGLGAAAAVHGGVFLAGSKPAALGCETTGEIADPHGWNTDSDAQRLLLALRQSPVAPHVGLALPRVLLRNPYGRDSDEIDSFPFEEMAERRHEDYLWGSPAWHCTRLLAQQFTGEGWSMTPGGQLDLGFLPAHSFVEDGETRMQPCAELLIPESAMTAILDRGLMPVVSYRNRNTAVLGRFQSIAEPLQPLAGKWAATR